MAVYWTQSIKLFSTLGQKLHIPNVQFLPGEQETTEHLLCHCIGDMTIWLHTLGSPLIRAI